MQPTEQQELILKHDGNAVIIAAPGSGKTFVISQKIRSILTSCHQYHGVIAISFTKKASGELKERCLKNGLDPKSSFFGTIDKFYIGEIIIPFGKQIWKQTGDDFSTPKISTLDEEQQRAFEWVKVDNPIDGVSDEQIDILRGFFKQGIIPLETVDILANYIFRNSLACRKYLKARYKAIYIDEYQDCGSNQHLLFEQIVALGITGVAVGDINQSIYAFSGKSSKYLSGLTSSPNFKTFKLDKNHRCHPSVINYSNYLLDPNIEMLPTSSSVVKLYSVDGDETQIAAWLDQIIAKIAAQQIKNNQIGILTKSNRTSDLINQHLKAPHKLIATTDLDLSLTIWSGIFSNLLHFAYDPSFRFIEVIEEFVSFDKLSPDTRRKLVKFRAQIKTLFAEAPLNIPEVVNVFTEIAEQLAPKSKTQESVKLLSQILNLPTQLDAYKPTNENDVNIMTLHKSKGLEFDVVLHLDLHEWVFPSKYPDNGEVRFHDYFQDLNLHYVGITRARKGCLLVTSTKRTNKDGDIKNGAPSEFLFKDGIEKLRAK